MGDCAGTDPEPNGPDGARARLQIDHCRSLYDAARPSPLISQASARCRHEEQGRAPSAEAEYKLRRWFVSQVCAIQKAAQPARNRIEEGMASNGCDDAFAGKIEEERHGESQAADD
jgi:hypothetical protein